MFKPFAVSEVLPSFLKKKNGFFLEEGGMSFDMKKMRRVCSYIMLPFLVLICLGEEFTSLSLVL